MMGNITFLLFSTCWSLHVAVNVSAVLYIYYSNRSLRLVRPGVLDIHVLRMVPFLAIGE